MKKIFTLLLLCSCVYWAAAQRTISGELVDSDSGEKLIGATVVLEGTQKGTTTDIDGKFKLEDVASGSQNLLINYIGYQALTLPISASKSVALGAIRLYKDEKVLSEVEVIASLATDRRTPVAVTTLQGSEIALTVGNKEYVETLRKTPSIYVTKGSGGFGDSRINVRGFDQRNTAVMINGIPVNDMENGWVYWSNWAGLSDVTSKLQVQRGLGATKLAAPTVGGSINIITNAANLERKGTLSFGVGNDAYLKSGISYSTGLLENGLAASVQITRKQGDGYIDGTQFSAWSYFAALSKVFNDNQTISISAVGAPQWHHQRSTSSFDEIYLQTYLDNGIKNNHVWGTLDGEEFSWRRNFYHKPKVFLNHYWNMSSRTDLKTSAYISFGRGGGTGPRGRLRTPGSVFDSFGSGTHNLDGQVRFDDIVAYNQGVIANTDTTLKSWGDPKSVSEEFDGLNVVSEDGRIYTDSLGNVVSDDHSEYSDRTSNGSGFVRRASMNYHNWYGVLSTLTHKFTDEFTFTTGIDGRYYKGEHFRRLENLLGADGYSSKSNINNQANLITETSPATFFNFFDNSYKDGTNVLNYHNDGIVGWLGLFGQLEYVKNDLSAFASLSGSNQSFKRIDYFGYNIETEEYISDWASHLGGTVKAGANYNFGVSNVFANAGFISRQPVFDDVFLNFSNDIDESVENQTVTAFEVGYGLKMKEVSLKLNAYTTKWDNQTISRGQDVTFIEGPDTMVVEGTAIFRGVDQRHTGIELEAKIKPNKILSFDAMLSLGNWKYTDDFEGVVYDDNQNVIDEATLYVKDQPIGDAAQTTFSLGATVYPIDDLRIYAEYFYADRLFAQFRVDEDLFRQPGGVIQQLPGYGLLDAGASYKIPFGDMGLTVYANINNILNNEYIAEMYTNNPDDPTTEDVNEFYTQNQGYFGYGTTWNFGVKLNF